MRMLAEADRKLRIALKRLVVVEKVLDEKDERIESLETELSHAASRRGLADRTGSRGSSGSGGSVHAPPRLPIGYPGASVVTLARYGP